MRLLALLALLACVGEPPADAPAAGPAPVEVPAEGAPVAATTAEAPTAVAAPSYAELRAGFRTRLTRTGPAPERAAAGDQPASVKVLRYPSPVGSLPAWLLLPDTGGARMPVVVFAHPGYALSPSVVDDLRPLLQSGFSVLVPTWRGENGNPGSFEMFAGEVDDLEAAVRWVTERPEVDGKRVYAFGQGAGGQLVSLLALRDGVPLLGAATVGALYRSEDLLYWRKIVPFDLDDPVEVRMRLLFPNLADLRAGLLAFVGADDATSAKSAASFDAEARRLGAPLRVVTVRGDERTSLGPAMAKFIEAVKIQDFPRRWATGGERVEAVGQ